MRLTRKTRLAGGIGIAMVVVGLASLTVRAQSGSGDPDGFLDPRQPNTIPQDLQNAIADPIATTPTVAAEPWVGQIPFVGQLDSGSNLQMAEVAPKIFFGFQQNAEGNQRVRSGFVAARRLANGTFAKLNLPGNVLVLGYDGQSVVAVGDPRMELYPGRNAGRDTVLAAARHRGRGFRGERRGPDGTRRGLGFPDNTIYPNTLLSPAGLLGSDLCVGIQPVQ